jgi:hypothetical protein
VRLDRVNGRGKYGLIKVRRLAEIEAWDGSEGELSDRQAVLEAIKLLERAGVIDWGDTPETEFFAIRLRDKFACSTLHEYVHAALVAGHNEYANDVLKLARRSGIRHPNCKLPD